MEQNYVLSPYVYFVFISSSLRPWVHMGCQALAVLTLTLNSNPENRNKEAGQTSEGVNV